MLLGCTRAASSAGLFRRTCVSALRISALRIRPALPPPAGARPARMAAPLTTAMAALDAMLSDADGAAGAPAAAGAAALAPPPGGATVPSIAAELATLFSAAIAAAFPGAAEPAALAPCNNPANGDYQCNNAMALFGRMKKARAPGAPASPRAAAEAILAALPASPLVAATSLAGPGFINVRLAPAALAARLTAMLRAGSPALWAPRAAAYAGQRVVVDFSSPNVAKEMHVGHLRSTIIGDTLSRLFEFAGADVLRLNHIGDWGTQFGMLIEFMAEGEGGLAAASGGEIGDLQVLYRAAKARFDEDEGFKTRAREAVTRLQGGDPAALEAWARICGASRAEFQKIYDRLGVQLEERGESFYNPLLKDVVDELVALGVAVPSKEAICFFIDGPPPPDAPQEELDRRRPPLIVRKGDGGYGYASTDMAAVRHRVRDEGADRIVYITDAGQALHFESVFAAAEAAGYLAKPGAAGGRVRLDHVTFGLVLGDDNKKFRSRSGDAVRLVDLLDKARDDCAATIRERSPDIPADELAAAAAAMGYGAVKYADLRSHRATNYRFSFEEMLALKGNTAVYLLYAHARIAAIARKAGAGKEPAALLAAGAEVVLEHERELALGLHIARFPEAVEAALEELAPNRLTDYLHELSTLFNQFYAECQVVEKSGESVVGAAEAPRLLLCEATAAVMRACFALLGITPLYRI